MSVCVCVFLSCFFLALSPRSAGKSKGKHTRIFRLFFPLFLSLCHFFSLCESSSHSHVDRVCLNLILFQVCLFIYPHAVFPHQPHKPWDWSTRVIQNIPLLERLLEDSDFLEFSASNLSSQKEHVSVNDHMGSDQLEPSSFSWRKTPEVRWRCSFCESDPNLCELHMY